MMPSKPVWSAVRLTSALSGGQGGITGGTLTAENPGYV